MSRVEHYLTAIAFDGGRIVGGCRCGGAFMCNTANWSAVWNGHIADALNGHNHD